MTELAQMSAVTADMPSGSTVRHSMLDATIWVSMDL